MGRLLILVILLACCSAWGQEKLGIVNSNYSSTNSIFLNPSSSADSRTYMQLKLAGLNVYGTTNLGYQPAFSVWALRSPGALPPPVARDNERNKFGLAVAQLEGPCFVISKDNFGAGIFVRGRSVVNIRRLPYQVTSLLLAIEPLSTDVFDIDVRNAGFNNMSWLEAGGNFSYMIIKNKDNLVAVGANASYLMGLNLLYANMRTLRGLYTDSLIGVDEINGKMVQNAPAFMSGKGVGVDIGLTYKRMLRHVDNYLAHSVRSNCRWIDYKFKVGLTLRDLGYIRFGNTTTRTLSGQGYLNLRRGNNDLTEMPVLNINSSVQTGPARAMLPLMLSAQFDYNFENYIYVAGVFMKNLVPPGATGVQGTDLFAVVPRFETKNVEVSLPVTFIRYVRPQLGFAFRFRTFVVGVDNVLPFVMRTNLSTFGIYVNVGISIFRNHACGSRGGNVDDCGPGVRVRKQKKEGFFKRLLGRNKTYRK